MKQRETSGLPINHEPVKSTPEHTAQYIQQGANETAIADRKNRQLKEQLVQAEDEKELQLVQERLTPSQEVIDIPDMLDKEMPSVDELREREAAYRQEYEHLTGENGEIAKLTAAINETTDQGHVTLHENNDQKGQNEPSGWIGWIFMLFNRPVEAEDNITETPNAASNALGLDNEHNNLLIRRELYRKRAEQLEGYLHVIDSQ